MRVLIAGRVASTGEAEREAKAVVEDGMVVPETATAAAETEVAAWAEAKAVVEMAAGEAAAGMAAGEAAAKMAAAETAAADTEGAAAGMAVKEVALVRMQKSYLVFGET